MLELFHQKFRKMPGQFRSNVWDPVLIIAQMVAMQCQFYVTLGILVYLLDFIGGYDPSIEQLFKQADKSLFSDGSGKVNTIAYAFNSLASAVGLWCIICRTKLCLDFTVTVHLFHFGFCWVFNGYVPHTLSWFILNLVCITLTTVIGEFLCMRTEMKAIPLSSLGPKADV